MSSTASADTPQPGSAVSRPWLKHYDSGVPAHLDYLHIPIWRMLADSAAKQPDRTAVLFFGRRFSYGYLEEQSNRLAAGLQRLGVRAGDRVALLLPNAPQYLVAYYSALKSGAVVVPLNPLYSEHELLHHLNDSGSETVITLPMFLEKIGGLRSKAPLRHVIVSRLADSLPFPLNLAQDLRERRLVRAAGRDLIDDFRTLLAPAPDFKPELVDSDSMAVLIYSGGTTGTAKGIMLSHFQCVANAIQAAAWGNLSDEERLLAVLPLFHGFGMSVTMNAPVLVGGEVVLLPRFSATGTLKAIQKYRPSFFIGVPTMFTAFNSIPDFERYDLSSLRGIFVGAAPLTQTTKDTFEAKSGARMIEGYGLTEIVTACMANPYKGLQKIGSIGLPFPDIDARIVSLEDGRDLPPGQSGEIVLRGPTLMLGYFRNPEETARTIVDGWLFTGDIGHMDEDGYFYITDRKKDLIIVGGFNVFPREIEEILYQHSKIKEGVAVGVPDPFKGERIKIFAVLKDGQTATPEEVIEHFRAHLVPYKVPSEVEFRMDLPKSMIGKILRRPLREEEIARQQKESER